jgi:hypothetical protein
MAKYWEDNMVSFVVLILLYTLFFSIVKVLEISVEEGPS